MATIVTRSGKGSPLTHAEVDANFTNLNTDKLELSGGTMTGNLSFGDNDKAIFGAGSDLQIYHDGATSDKIESSSSFLILEGSNIILRNNAGTEDYAKFFGNGAVELYSDNSKKLATTATGVDITGTLTSDGLTVDGDVEVSSLLPRLILNETDITDLNTAIRNNAGVMRVQTVNDAANSFTKRIDLDHSTGDISFYEDTGTTAKFFWDASAESLGIGTSSPSSPLTIKSSTSGYDGGIRIITGSGAETSAIAMAGTSLYLSANAADDHLVIDSSGNVGIGTSSPQRPLHVDGVEGVARFTSTASGNNGFEVGIGASSQAFLWQSENSYMHFATNATERMRITSGGNLLVGTTVENVASSSTETGVRMGDGFLQIGRSNSDILILNRQTSDGDIAVFRKDGTTVGSIGVKDSDLYIGKDAVGLTFDATGADGIRPFNVSAEGVRDNGIDLGGASARFKDLYLSGGVYLGGTGSANKLDDYESGTWTPSFSGGFSSVTYSTQSGVYTKIGDLVICKMRLTMSAFTGDANFLTIQGLPFTIENVTAQSGGAAPMLDNLTATVNNITVQPTTGGTTFIFITGNGGTGSHSGLRGNQCTVNTDIRATIIYQAA